MPEKKPDSLAIPTFIKQWRNHRGLTQEELGEQVGLTTSSVSQLENGKQGFTDGSLAKYARALGCSPLQLLAHDPSRPDSFWPLFEAAEKTSGRERRRLYVVMRAAAFPEEEQ